MTKRNRLGVLAAMCCLALVATACGDDGGGSGSGSDSGSIKVGAEVSATGEVGFYGAEQQKGFELAEAKINADGGINGKDLDLEIKDNASKTENSVVNFKDFVGDKDMVATIGPTSSRDALAALAITAQANMASLTNALAPDVMEIGDNVYRPIAADTDMIPPFVANQVESMGITTVAFLGANTDPNALAAHDTYVQAFDDAGVETVADETYAGGDTQWSAQLAKIKDADPDVLVLSVLAQEAGNLLIATRDAGITVPIFGAAALNSQAAVDQAGAAANDVYIPDFWAPDFDSPENKAFVEAYQEKYDGEPTRFAASAYEAVYFLYEALKKAEDPNDRASVLKAFGEVTTFPVIGSDLTMVDRGAVTDNPVVLHVVDGKFTTEQ